MLRRLRRMRANRRANKAALASLTPAQRQILRVYGIPPRFAATVLVGTYENATDERNRWFGRLTDLAVMHPARPPRRPEPRLPDPGRERT